MKGMIDDSEAMKRVWEWKEKIYLDHKTDDLDTMIKSILSEAKDISDNLKTTKKLTA